VKNNQTPNTETQRYIEQILAQVHSSQESRRARLHYAWRHTPVESIRYLKKFGALTVRAANLEATIALTNEKDENAAPQIVAMAQLEPTLVTVAVLGDVTTIRFSAGEWSYALSLAALSEPASY
jgi:hypothetical protein